ncbi:uncharacterized protein Z518_05779 [Rhinocladiella mackenziei CBS 650.93]|uniref:FAD-binding domain-containing protein n=1 Tax=Rhinocladiella mackenziei CBS 650.93 TaxID=1442369 RepID=A0A0D2H3B4_9EURO|nr:uncharacterized protein Z518_05779 [Rhinocladiella mackenziei CBS 650.93]KIX04908.1 hypothetical protein Z518_05779 [Rhinocladiella mackenziei CBS 650.93]
MPSVPLNEFEPTTGLQNKAGIMRKSSACLLSKFEPLCNSHRRQLAQTCVQVLREQGMELQYDSKCVGIQEMDHSTVITAFADDYPEEADFLIGYDGNHSGTRSL